MSRKKQENPIEVSLRDVIDDATKIECDKHRLFHEGYANYNANLNGDLAIVFIGYVKAEKGYNYSYKNFPFYRIGYTESGQASLRYPQKNFTLKSGMVYGLAPKDTGAISVESINTWNHYYLQFCGKDAAKVFNQTMLNTKKVIQASNPLRFLQFFENMIEEERNKIDSAHIINAYLLRVLLLKLENDACKDNTDDKSIASRQTYSTCRNYINANFSQICNFQELAHNCNVSKPYLCHLFKQYTNTSPMSYVMNLKMNKAAVMLTQTEMSIKQISLSLCFEDQYYFSKLFKKHYGMSPKFYRKKIS